MGDVVIRQLRSNDTTVATRTLARLKPSDERRDRLPDEQAAQLFLQQKCNILIAATQAEEPIGYAIAYILDRAERSEPMLLLYEIEVAPENRRQGIARAMIERLRQIATEHGAFKMWVLTDPSNRSARALYGSSGGTELGENLLVEWFAADLSVQTPEATP